LRQQIDGALSELSPEHRAVVQLREFDGLDYAEIAKAKQSYAWSARARSATLRWTGY